MSAVTIHCMWISDVSASQSEGRASIAVDMEVTAAQRKDALRALLGAMPEQEAFEFMRGECPEWFEVPQ